MRSKQYTDAAGSATGTQAPIGPYDTRGYRELPVIRTILRFWQDHDLSEIWGGLLRDSADRPEVYGSDTVRNALFRLLEHIYHGRKVEFPRIFADLLADYAKKPSDLLFVPAVKQDLIKLGYSRKKWKSLSR